MLFAFQALSAKDAPAEKTVEAKPAKEAADAAGKAEEKPKPMTLEEAKVYFSRNIGVNFGSQLKADEMVLKEEFLKGLNDALAGKADAKDIDQAKMMEAQQLMAKAQMEQERKKNEDFIAKNKAKKDVKSTKSGLQYKVIKEGEGASPAATDQVEVHYTGKFIDGTVFDSSVQRGVPAVFEVNRVISGWTEGLQLMKPGAKYEFFIPWNLAYGERGSGRSIPPYSALVFEVELLKVIKPEAAPEKKPAVEEKAPEKK